MVYTTEMMVDDYSYLDGTIKRIIVVDNVANVANIKILIKRGYSWVDIEMGIRISGYQFTVTDQYGNLMLKAEPPKRLHE